MKAWPLLVGFLLMLQSASADAASAASDPFRFDLSCSLHGRTVAVDANRTGLYPNKSTRWTYDTRYVVDLKAMNVCEVDDCVKLGIRRVQSASASRIVFEATPEFRQTYDRRTRAMRIRNTAAGQVDITNGVCHVLPFSGFPPGAKLR